MERSRTRTKTKRGNVRVYHFVGPDFGLDDIRRRRLKIATIADLNDPFELLPSSTDQTIRARFKIWRQQFDLRFGMLCFSRKWTNPVQWSHYAAKHTGLCLGFDIALDRIVFGAVARIETEFSDGYQRDWRLDEEVHLATLLTRLQLGFKDANGLFRALSSPHGRGAPRIEFSYRQIQNARRAAAAFGPLPSQRTWPLSRA